MAAAMAKIQAMGLAAVSGWESMRSMIVRLAGTHLLQGSAGVSIFRIKRGLHLVAALCLGFVKQFIDFLQPFFKGFRRGLCDGQHSATDRQVRCRSR